MFHKEGNIGESIDKNMLLIILFLKPLSKAIIIVLSYCCILVVFGKFLSLIIIVA